MVNFVIRVLSIGTLLAQVFTAILIGGLIWAYLNKKSFWWLNLVRKHALLLAFIMALVATLGSLFFSLGAGFTPCELCWYQRILMYPQAVLLGLALIKKDGKIADYILSLSAIGIVIPAYHNYIYYTAISSNFCKLGESCTVKFFTELGYITIPMMALTSFAVIITLMLARKLNRD